MPILGHCPGCGRKFHAPEKLAGKRVKCPNCSAVIQLARADQHRAVQQAASPQEAPQTPAIPKQLAPEQPQWYVQTADGQQLGPISKTQLDAMVAEGRLDGFCRLRRQDWQDWKWPEAVYPQFALVVEPEAQDANPTPLARTAAQTVAADPDSRLRPCPDCEKMVSKRADQCPHCGCPLAAPDDQAVAAGAAGQRSEGASGVAGSSQQGTGSIRRQVGLLVAGAVSAVLLIVVLVIVVLWQVWRKVDTVLSGPEQQLQSLAQGLGGQNEPLQQPTAQRNGKEMKGKAATPEEIEQAMQEAAAAAAKQLDDLYRKVHLLHRTEQSAALLRSILEDPLGRPGTEPTPAAQTGGEPYQSQYKPLYEECLAYIRQNLPAGARDRSEVWDLANRWAEAKRAPLEQELATLLEKQLGF
jgi:hypothetical protein